MRCLRGGVVDGCGGEKVKAVVVWLWLFGNDVGGGDLVVAGNTNCLFGTFKNHSVL